MWRMQLPVSACPLHHDPGLAMDAKHDRWFPHANALEETSLHRALRVFGGGFDRDLERLGAGKASKPPEDHRCFGHPGLDGIQWKVDFKPFESGNATFAFINAGIQLGLLVRITPARREVGDLGRGGLCVSELIVGRCAPPRPDTSAGEGTKKGRGTAILIDNETEYIARRSTQNGS